MTADQADQVFAILSVAYPRQSIPEATIEDYLEMLRALPWESGRLVAKRLSMTATFLPAKAEFIAAMGISDLTHRDQTNGLQQLLAAIESGQEIVADLATASGWAVGVAARPIPARVEPIAALDARPDITEEQRRDNLRRLGSFARDYKRDHKVPKEPQS